jgi:hypothetical protein
MTKSWYGLPKQIRALAVSAALLATACGTTDIPPTVQGTFELELTGDLNAFLSGEALFGESYQQFDDGTPPRRAFMIELQDFNIAAGTYHVTRFMRLEWTVPTTGAHVLGSAPTITTFQLAYFRVNDDEEVEVEITSTSGTLTLTEVGDHRIRGSFEFAGTGELVAGPGHPPIPLEVQGTGHFTAAAAVR